VRLIQGRAHRIRDRHTNFPANVEVRATYFPTRCCAATGRHARKGCHRAQATTLRLIGEGLIALAEGDPRAGNAPTRCAGSGSATAVATPLCTRATSDPRRRELTRSLKLGTFRGLTE
jgi:hypothetical protein